MTNSSRQDSVLKATSRRHFLQGATAATVAASLSSGESIARAAQVTGSDLLRVGLIGCGGRGTGAASQALAADPNVKLWAMGDAFRDRLESSLASLKADSEIGSKVDVPRERQFAGFEAYQQVIDSGVDVVLLVAPPHFRPRHLSAAVGAGKHVFAEKPVAVDAPGVRSVLATCELAKKKGLSIVSGLCLRYDQGFQETVSRIHDGALGEIRALQANDLRGGIWLKPRQAGWSDMEWQMRNWYYFTWLSGDFNVEQHVHYLDVCAWLMKNEYPVKAMGTGGRQVRTGPEYGNIYDHHSVIYEYANGVKLFSTCRQQRDCKNDMTCYAFGEKGTAEVAERRLVISAGTEWSYGTRADDMYQTEHDELFASIRSGRPINNGEYMSKSSLLAIMGRFATYTGQEITWEQAINSQEDLTPPHYEWRDLETPAIAQPGVTRMT
jgi:predicted dehydrogenase